jgi:hypothetical protein
VRVSTSSRSIVPPSSPRTRLRRFSSCARSSASERSRTIACIRSSIWAATAFSFASVEPPARRPSRNTATTKTVAAIAAPQAIRIVVMGERQGGAAETSL